MLKAVCEEGFMFIYLLFSYCYSFGARPYAMLGSGGAEMTFSWRRAIGQEDNPNQKILTE